ncbi:MAG: hypothetical protein KDD63_04140, partial [Bacteroidetes bacterium]|nr:hypothetical protein [Bacteroidota bacterium]
MARYSFIFLVVFVTTFAKAQFGNNGDLGVTLHNVTEGSSSIPGSNGEVELWLNSSRVGIESTNSNNSVLFQSISAANDYEIRAFHNSLAPFGKEYWGRKSGVWVNANQTNSADLYRYMPYFIGDLKVFSGGIEVTGQQIEVCIPLEFRVTIKSRASSGLNVKVEIKLDRSRGGSIDKQILSSNLNVPGNGTREFRIQFTPDYSFTGNYYAAIGTYTQQTIIGPTLTDGSNWTNLPVIRMTPGDPDLVVINPDINVNEAYPGDQITVECEVENQGCGVPLQSSYLGYFFSSQEDDPQEYLDRDVVPTLDPSQSSFESQTVTIPSNVSPGYYYIVFVADHTDDVNEGVGENNNISSERIYISDPSSDLDVYVHNVVGGQSGIPGSDGLVKFYGANRSNLIDAKSTSNQGNGVGRAAFRDLDQGSNRLIEVFYQPGSSTIFGDEFWGRMENITIPAPNDEVRFDRYMPHTLDNPQIFDANGHVTNGTVYQNSPVIIEVDVLNRSSSDLPVDVRIILDKDKQIPYDFDLTTGYETIAGNGAITTVSEGTVLAFTGDYYSAVATYLDDVHLNRSLTSGSAWSDNPIISVRSSLPPIADANNISNAPGSMYPNVQYAVTATYSDPNGVDDLFKCYLKLKHPTGDDLTLEYNADNGTAITLGNGWNYINVDEVAAQSNGNELTLTWKYTLNNNWQGAEGGIDFGVRALDDDAGDSGWSNRTVNGAFKWYGVTIITHGHTPPSFSGNQIDDWVFPMALKIWDRVGRCGTITTFDPVFGRLDTLAQGANINGESIVIADWIEESKHLPSGYSESSADAIFAALVRAENRGFLRLENIHLIGHSRGTVVNSEIVDRILQGIENYGQSWSINQVTNLDAHDWGMNILNVPGLGDVSAAPDWDINGELVIQDPPLRQPNRGAVSWLGIEWGDSYWQIPLGGEQPCFGLPEITPNFRCGKLAGRHVLGTALFPELPNSVDHGGVHEWYLGTIDTNLIIGDSYWYGGSMPTRSEGYNYSRVGGRKQRPTINEPREPREPWGHNFRDGIYNGDFSRGVSNGFTSAYDDLPVPGWGWGTGYSYTAKQNEGVLVFEEDHQVIEHNYFWIPLTAKEIWFQYHILLAEGGGANNTDRFQAELEILEPHNISIPITTLWLENETQYPIWNNLSGNVVDISQYQGSIARLRMALADYNNNGLHSKIWVDDIHFNLGPSVQSTPLEAIAIVPANSSLQYTLTPTFEWSLYQSGGDGESQSGYQVRVRIDDGTDRIIYDTGYIQAASGNSHVFSPGSYSGLDNETGDLRISEPLQWGQQYHWHVRYRDSGGDWGPWSHDDPDPHQIFFTNSPGTITAISPDGGEFRNPINLSVISGDPDPNSSIVSLEYRYSINGGNSWIPIGTDHTPDDPLAWNPTISTDHVLLCARANDGYLWSEWKVGENEVLIDNDPPVTTDNVPAGWQNSPFTVLLTADDNNGSGFDNTGYSAYSINGSTPLIGNAFDIESSGNHQIAYFSVDDVGNLEPMRISNHIAQLDLSNPIFQGWSQVPADLNTNSSGVLTVSVEVIETLSGIAAGNPKIQYRFDNNAWSQYYQMQAEGGYLWSFDIPEPSGGWQNRGGQVLYYRVRAEDVAGNTGVSAAQSVQIENIVADTPPVLTWSGNANFVDDGVHPQKAIPGNSFRFEVQYKDVNNDPPASGYPKLHLLFDGNPVVGSPFAMIPADNAPFSAGRNYFSNQVLSVADSTYSYFFEAPDQVGNPATGLATQPQRGILVNTPPLVSSVFISPNNANEEDQLLAYANYSDGDGHTVELRQYEWFRNGQYIAGVDTNILFPQEISAGDEIAVRITPWDGYEEGITGESVPITIHPAPRRKIHVDADNTGGPWDGSKATPFHNIQDGIDYAVNGDTVFVNSGWYFENIRISKSLILLGQNPQTTLI